jgi:hypothetical protein
VSFTRAKAFAVVVVASVLAMMTGPLFAGPSHEVCNAMHHKCAKIDALAACCCGDRSDLTPSRVASDRTIAGADTTQRVAIVPRTFSLAAVVAVFVHEGRPPLARPHDLPVLFSDLRL